jgi:predicted TPR repeat methyltransferase
VKKSESLRLEGITFARAGQFEEASVCFQKAIEQTPENYALYNDLGLSLARQGQFQEAEKQYLMAIEKYKEYVEALNNLASLYYKQERFEEALFFYQKAVSYNPDYLAAYYNMALIYMKLEQFDEAIIQFKKVISLSPKHGHAHFHLANLLVQKNHLEEAENHYHEAILQQPALVNAYTNLAVIYLKQNHIEDARKYYEQALTLDPALPEVHFNMGVILADQGKLNEAIIFYKKTIELDPCHAQAFQNLGACYYKQDNMALAIEYYEKAVSLSPADATLSYLLKALKQDKTQETAPFNYVRQLFDRYADEYDDHLQTLLIYQVPVLLKTVIEEKKRPKLCAWDVLDLGCGTGLMGKIMKPYAHYLLGVDLSKKMLLKAESKAIYDDLICADIKTFITQCNLRFDMVVAADVLGYIGKLEELFQAVHCCLKEKGSFAFSIELVQNEADAFCLQPTGRFKHGQQYIEKLANQCSFSIKHQKLETIRLQQGLPVEGMIFLLSKK